LGTTVAQAPKISVGSKFSKDAKVRYKKIPRNNSKRFYGTLGLYVSYRKSKEEKDKDNVPNNYQTYMHKQ
jgi:hypothetical protein